MGNQMEASTTAATAGSAERPFGKGFALMWKTTGFLTRPRYSPTQEYYSLKLIPYIFEIDGAVKTIEGIWEWRPGSEHFDSRDATQTRN